MGPFLPPEPPFAFGREREVQMVRKKPHQILAIDLQVRFRGAVYEFEFTRALKWIGALILVGIRFWRFIRGDEMVFPS